MALIWRAARPNTANKTDGVTMMIKGVAKILLRKDVYISEAFIDMDVTECLKRCSACPRLEP